MTRTNFVSFEGIDKTGKTVLCEMLKTKVPHYTFVSDPPALSPWDELFTDGWFKDDRWDVDLPGIVESYLFLAGRFHVYEEEIAKSLEEGIPVVSDRYADSWIAYQSVVRADRFDSLEDSFEFFKDAHEEFVRRGLLTNPDLTILITIDREELDARLEKTTDEEITGAEKRPDKLMEVQERYRILSGEFSDRYVTIDGVGQGIEEVYGHVLQTLSDRDFFEGG